VKFPRVTSEGEGIQMIVWNSPTAAHLTVNGNDQGYLHQGETYYLGARSPAAITLTTKDANGRLTTWSQTFMNQDYYGVHAEVLILGTQDLH
jgi:hypothetical protein